MLIQLIKKKFIKNLGGGAILTQIHLCVHTAVHGVTPAQSKQQKHALKDEGNAQASSETVHQAKISDVLSLGKRGSYEKIKSPYKKIKLHRKP